MEAQHLARRYKSYMIIGNILYERSTSGIVQRCISQEEGQRLLLEAHVGIYGHHMVPRMLVGKVFQQGFYWLTAVVDTQQIIRSYEGC
jgi:hypothetical protein